MDDEWLNTLKAGDRVVVANNYGERLDSVTRTTDTQIICGNSRYRKSNGYAFGGDTWNSIRLIKPTTAIMEKIEMRDLRERLEKIAKDKETTLATLRAMYAAAKPSPPAGEVA